MQHDLTLGPNTSPAPIYRYRDGIYAVELLIVALSELDLFSALAGGPLKTSDLLDRLDVRERPGDVMLTLLVAMGLLERDRDAVRLSELSREHLTSGSPWFLGPYYESLRQRPVCQTMLTALRDDRTADWHDDEWAKEMENPEFAASFTREMDCRGVTLGPALAEAHDWNGCSHLLDVGGGSAVYACAVAARHPDMKATVLEKPPVDRIAHEAIEKRGYSGRVAVVAADMFEDDWPGDCDAHLFSNVFHDWGEARVRQLIDSSHRFLPPDGSIIIHDAHINAEKTGPLPVAEYSALLMHFTEGKCYSVRELERFLTEAGFDDVAYAPTAAERSIVTARKA